MPGSSDSTHKVLVVDDCRMNTLLLRHILRQEGIPSEAAASGPEAITKARAGNYDLIFLDIMMPGMDGFDTAAEINRRCSPPPPIYLLTALGEDYVPERARSAGVAGVIFKPIVPSRIVELVRHVTGTRDTAAREE